MLLGQPELANREDWPAIQSLLEMCQLPMEGIQSDHCFFWVLREGTHFVGCCALEVYPPYVLIRSVAVDPNYHGYGLGRKLVEIVLRHAKAIAAETAYLLTTTADGYFPRFGFEPIQRSQVPMAVQQSKEFTSICPTSAIVMRKTL